MELHEQEQCYNNYFYSVTDILDIAKNVKTETVDIRLISKYYALMGNKDQYDLVDLVGTMKRVLDADLNYPIIIYRGYVMDGKHRLAKALLQGKKTIKIKIIDKLPVGIAR